MWPVLLEPGIFVKILTRDQLIETFDDNTRVSIGYYYMILILAGILIIGFFRIRHMLLDIRRDQEGITAVFYLSW